MSPLVGPGSGLRVTLLLADYAAVAEGKLYISGAGWSIRAPIAAPFAIALKFDVPWHMTNQPITFSLELQEDDGELVHDGKGNEIRVAGQLEVGRPPGLRAGSSIDAPLAIPIPPLELKASARYVWVLRVNGETQDDWTLPFSVAQLPMA